MIRYYLQENKEIQSLLAVVEEAESRDARLPGASRAQQTRESDEGETGAIQVIMMTDPTARLRRPRLLSLQDAGNEVPRP